MCIRDSNKVQLHHRHVKSFHMVKRLQKLVQYIRRYSTKYDKPRRNAISIRLFSTETTGAIYTKILTLVVLFNHAYAWRYPISFLNARATKMRSLPFFHKIGCHGNVPWDIEKRCPDRSSAPKRLKSCENWSSTSGDFWQNMPNPTRTRNEISICYLVLCRYYCTDLHQFFTRCSGISGAIYSCTYVALDHSVSERKSKEWRWSILTSDKNAPKLIDYHSNVP